MAWIDAIGVLSCLVTVTAVVRTRVRFGTHTPGAAGSSWGAPPPRRGPARVTFLGVLAVATAVSTFAVAHGPPVLRIPLALVALLLAPGYAIVVLRGVRDVLDELALALAFSIALAVLAGTAMASLRIWEPALLVGVSTLCTAPVLARQAAYHLLLPAATPSAARPVPVRDADA